MALPHPRFPDFYTALAEPAMLTAWEGDVFRKSLPKWLSKPYRLTGVGAVLTGGRWNVQKLMPVVYGCGDLDTLHDEVHAKAHKYGWSEADKKPRTEIAMHWKLQAVLNLTDSRQRKALGVSSTDLMKCDWEAEQQAGRESLTQALARAAFERMAEGLLVPSARRKGGFNVVMFHTHLRAGSTVETLHEADTPFHHGL